jgi:hypothetical protein
MQRTRPWFKEFWLYAVVAFARSSLRPGAKPVVASAGSRRGSSLLPSISSRAWCYFARRSIIWGVFQVLHKGE